MAERSALTKWGCGCLTVVLIWYVGIPVAMVGLKLAYDAVGGIRARYHANVEEWRSRQKAKEESERLAAERAKEEAERKAAIIAEEKKREEARRNREERIRAFAVNEAPALWKTYQDLQGAIAEQNNRIADLAKTLKDFDKEPSQDRDYVRICAMRDEMVAAVKSMRTKIEDAYLAYCKFQATPSRREYDELQRKILEDGIKEAEGAMKHFDQMRKSK